jgi:hypothetical protein
MTTDFGEKLKKLKSERPRRNKKTRHWELMQRRCPTSPKMPVKVHGHLRGSEGIFGKGGVDEPGHSFIDLAPLPRDGVRGLAMFGVTKWSAQWKRKKWMGGGEPISLFVHTNNLTVGLAAELDFAGPSVEALNPYG